MEEARERLLKDWQDESQKQWTGSSTCPTCGQPLPADQIEKAMAEFNRTKAERLESINEKGKRECSADLIAGAQVGADQSRGIYEKLEEELKDINARIAEEEGNLVATTDWNVTEESMALSRKWQSLMDDLNDARNMEAKANAALTQRIAEIDSQIEAEQAKLACIGFVKQQDARIEELAAREKELGEHFENLQKGLYLCELYTRKQAEMLDEKINSHFETLRFRLFIEQQNGGIADDCEALVPCEGRGLVPFKSANNAARINAGLEVIDTLAGYYGVEMPVFCDNAESVTKFRPTNTQIIRLEVSEADKDLRFEFG